MRAMRPVGWWTGILLFVASVSATTDLRLVQAVQDRHAEVARVLVTQRVDVNARQGDGATALHWAAHWDDLDIADLLIRAGADVNAANDLGVTPLLIACSNRNPAMVHKLLSARANPNAATLAGQTPIMAASRTGSAEVVGALVAHGADVNAMEPSRRQTALMWAVAQRHTEVVEVLIKHGANVHARSKVRPTFVNRGDGGRNEKGVMVDEGGSTPLLFAARSDDIGSAKLVIGAGANVDDPAPDGTTALVIAAHSGHGSLAAFLLDKGADPNANGAGYTALHAAVLRGDLDLVEKLLARGANPNAQLMKGTPLRRNSQDYVLPGTLIGATPFWLAAKFVEVDIMRVLAANGADPLFIHANGTTTLMMAAGIGTAEEANRRGITVIDGGRLEDENRVLEAAKLAIDLGANVNAQDNAGETALHSAASKGYNSVVRLLAERGTILGMKNKRGQTALALTAAGPRAGTVYGTRELQSTADLLRELGAKE